MQSPVAFDEFNNSEILWICASINMAIYATEMIKLEANHDLVTLQQLLSENDFFTKYVVHKISNASSFIVHFSSCERCGCGIFTLYFL